jgi:hypothetical protein
MKAGHLQMYNYAWRVVSRLKRDLAYHGLAPRFQPFEYRKSPNVQGKLSILIVASGSVHIPTNGWGAVETIIAETIPTYLESGINVGLLNTQNVLEWKKSLKISYDVIICHSDTHIEKVRRYWPNTPLISVTHYGLAAQPDLWHPSYRKVLSSLSHADKIVCLSPAIFKTFSQFLPTEKLVQIGNGSSFSSTQFNEKRNTAVVVGKIEVRKRQFELWEYSKLHGLGIDFLGPIEDLRVSELIKRDKTQGAVFKGPRSRSELTLELPSYKALVLISEGEADALVLYEAQLAGLEIIVNSDSLGSQDPKLPWVHLVDKFEDLNQVFQEISMNPYDPHKIVAHAKKHYRWNARLKPLITLIEGLAQNER